MSVGTKAVYDSNCDAKFPTLSAEIVKLRRANIATIISAGNSRSTVGIGEPACISSAISVAGSDSNDEIDTEYSNFSPQVSLVAPGTGIYGAIPGGGYAYMRGTSMAAPAVAGAFAVLRQVSNTADVTGLLNILQAAASRSRWATSRRSASIFCTGTICSRTRPTRRRLLCFDTAQIGNYWTPFLGSWDVDGKGYDLTGFNQKSIHNATWFPSCMSDTEVTADVTRVNGDQSTGWATGVVVDGLFDQNRKTVSGYWAIYNDVSAITDTYPVQLYRLDNYDFGAPGGPGETQLCSAESDAVHHNGKNVLKSHQEGRVHQLHRQRRARLQRDGQDLSGRQRDARS